MRIGLFGGTFDPPHVGHLLAASDACDALGLERVVFIPNARQPLKADSAAAPAEDRLRMVELLCAEDRRFEVDATEVRRGGLSYTVETLREYRARNPDAELFLLLGEDVVNTLTSWREWGAVRTLADVVVLARDTDASAADGAVPDGLRRIGTRRVDISASEIRERVRCGRPVTGFVPRPVADYIAQRSLYSAAEPAQVRRRNEP